MSFDALCLCLPSSFENLRESVSPCPRIRSPCDTSFFRRRRRARTPPLTTSLMQGSDVFCCKTSCPLILLEDRSCVFSPLPPPSGHMPGNRSTHTQLHPRLEDPSRRRDVVIGIERRSQRISGDEDEDMKVKVESRGEKRGWRRRLP